MGCRALQTRPAVYIDNPRKNLRPSTSGRIRREAPDSRSACRVRCLARWSVMAIALTLLRADVTDRDLYLFDTFTGMTEPGDEDKKRGGRPAAEILRETDSGRGVWAEASVEEVREAVLSVGYPEEGIHFVKGR